MSILFYYSKKKIAPAVHSWIKLHNESDKGLHVNKQWPQEFVHGKDYNAIYYSLRYQSNQIERSINRIHSNPIELNHVIGFDWQLSQKKNWSNGTQSNVD